MKKKLLRVANALLGPIGVQLYRNGTDMESVLRMIAARDPNIATVIDLGAARGHWSELALAFFPHARFLGVDPLREREPYLRSLKARNPRFDYVLGVAGEDDGGTAKLAVTADLDGSTVEGGEGEVREVPVHSLDALAARQELSGPYFIKFDTHGFEVPILNGAERTLAETKYLVMEVYNYRVTGRTLLFHEMCALLETKGFRVFNLADPLQRPGDHALWQMDLFFARHDDPIFASNSFRDSRSCARG